MASPLKSSVSKGVAAVLMGGFLGTSLAMADTYSSGGAASRTANWDSQHVINLQDVEMSVLIDDVSRITGYTFIVHPTVRGQVTVSSQTPLSTAEVFQVFLSTLRVHGFTAVPGRNGIYKIVPEQAATAEAALASQAVIGDQVETAVFKLRSINAVEAAKMIKPVTNPQGQVSTSAASNSVIVVDYASNIGRVRELVGQIDEDRSDIVNVALENMSAAEMAKTLNGLMSGTSAAFNYDVGAIAVDSSNSVVLRGDRQDVARMVEVVRQLDQESRIVDETIKVLPLKFATAIDLDPILKGIGARMAEAASRGGSTIAAPTVVAHEPTNSLVINAEPQILRQLERVVEDLDVRRAQVLVEAIVVELSDQATRELGLQFVVGGGEDNTVPFATTNFTRNAPTILSLAGAFVPDDVAGATGSADLANAALNSLLNTNGALLGVGGQNDDGLIFGAIVNAVQGDVDSNILSTPSVMALDNENAFVTSGQEIPIVTGEALGANNQNPFRTVERQDVGVTLEIKPQISEGDTIRLNLRQEVSSIAPVSGASDIITNKRELSTTVLADDGEVIVLGGLIQDDQQDSVEKVPLLGDVPLLGRLFRSERTSRNRTNLMVFLRPTIIRDTETVRDVTAIKYDYVRDAQIDANPAGTSSLDEIVRELIEGQEREGQE
ncbi:MAG: type II secretion system secretin GspD [Pseudomonadota bacterium]